MARGHWLAIAALALLWLGMGLGGGPGSRLDHRVLSWLYAGDGAALAAIAAALTECGGWKVLVPVSVAGAVLLFLRSARRRDAWVLLAVCLSGRVLVELQKVAIGRPRPGTEHLVEVYTLSFPSGHAANTAITCLALALLLSSGRRAVLAAALAFAVAVGASRSVLGVHWPSDVAGGLAFGWLWVLLWLQPGPIIFSGRTIASNSASVT